jgi:hypothetical protein
MFERWFKALCINLKGKYRFCDIHMDGAGYHNRKKQEFDHSVNQSLAGGPSEHSW